MDALNFLTKIKSTTRQPVYVLSGDEPFLKKQSRDAIRKFVLGDGDGEFSITTYEGDKIEDISPIRNDLETVSFFSPVRLVEIDNADDFISDHRAALERYLQKPSQVGVLVVEVKSFPETTNLAKMLPDEAKISCKSPKDWELAGWCFKWARAKYQKSLDKNAAELLVMYVGTSMGMLANELEKLATATGDRSDILPADIEEYVSRTRAAEVFKILDHVGDNKPDKAILILNQLLEQGVEPLAILGPLTYSLKRLAAIDRFVSEGQPLAKAMDSAKIMAWPQARETISRQLKHLGRNRLQMLSEWIAETNINLKGGSALPDHVVLEKLLVKLAMPK